MSNSIEPIPSAEPAHDSLASLLREDPARGIAEAARRAQAGDVEAQLIHAQILIEGRGVEADAVEAVHWYTLAASQGSALAMNMLGRCHELGQGTPTDAELATIWFRRAAEHGSDWGMYNYAHSLATGRGVAADRQGAYAWYRRAADLGHAKSMNFVGRFHEEGWVQDADRGQAVLWYQRSAEGGDFRGQASYAACLAAEGRLDEAAGWLRRALAEASPAFLATLLPQLANSPHASMRALAAEFEPRP